MTTHTPTPAKPPAAGSAPLAACPFCGGKAELMTTPSGNYEVFCVGHHCPPPDDFEADDPGCGAEIGVFAAPGLSLEAAIAAWNRRAPQAAPVPAPRCANATPAAMPCERPELCTDAACQPQAAVSDADRKLVEEGEHALAYYEAGKPGFRYEAREELDHYLYMNRDALLRLARRAIDAPPQSPPAVRPASEAVPGRTYWLRWPQETKAWALARRHDGGFAFTGIVTHGNVLRGGWFVDTSLPPLATAECVELVPPPEVPR